jgi:hypothetical protein
MIDPRKSAGQILVLTNNVSLAVDVEGRAEIVGEAPQRDAFTMQLAVPILECIHRQAHPNNASALRQD